ncbi:GNAT family N-acetyltransferase [Sphingobium limneticum]|uniref:GNAT family N-acetyltransferase n=1 Tax=Sphingobium limneticum TaxID=1007511 RepID=UPI003D0089BD
MIDVPASVAATPLLARQNVNTRTSPKFIARPASVHDAKALAALKTALSVETEHMVFDVADPHALLKRCNSELQASKLGEQGIFVVETRKHIVGYIDVRRVTVEGAYEFASFNLAIRPQYWGNGLGAQLISLAEKWAKGRQLRFLMFLVAIRNHRARALYDRLGYSICDIVRVDDNNEIAADEAYIMGRMILEADCSAPPESGADHDVGSGLC